MADIAYSFAPITPVLRINSRAAGNQSHSDVTRISGSEDGFFVAFNSSVGSSVNGRSFSESGHALSGEFRVNTADAGDQANPATLALPNGKVVTTYDDYTKGRSYITRQDVRGSISDQKGQDNHQFFLDHGYPNIGQSGYGGARDTDVARIKGGYVVSWMRVLTETGNYLAQRFNANGDKVGEAFTVVQTSTEIPVSHAVASLANGGFVSATAIWELPGDTSYFFQRFDAKGHALDTQRQQIVGPQSVNNLSYGDIKVVGLRDGGFAVAYVDVDTAHNNDKDILVRIYNANGTARTGALHVGVSNSHGGTWKTGNQDEPNITVLSNDAVAISWTDHTGADTNIQGRVLDSRGNALTGVVDLAASASRGETESSLADLSGGKFVATWTTTHESGTNTTGIQGREFRLSRTTTGDDTNETLNGDSLVDRIFGQGGDDIINGKSGNDVLIGGAGKDIFVFDLKPSRQTNFDKIADFSPVDDSIYLSHKIFSALGKGGSMAHPTALSKAAFWVGTAAQDANDRIIYNKASGALYYDPDGNGGAEALKIAALSKGLQLTEKDFFII